MIESKVKIKNLGIIDRYNKKLGQADDSLRGLGVYGATLLKRNVHYQLTLVLGDSMKHFSVDVIPGGFYNSVVVNPRGVVGAVLYGGSKAHSYSSSRPMPMPSGRFTYRVNHPGTKGNKEKIDQAMARAAEMTREQVAYLVRMKGLL